MANTLPSVRLLSKQWVDLYVASGITVGAKLIVQNLSGHDARIVEASSQPSTNDGYNIIEAGGFLTSADDPVGVWAYAYPGVMLQVEEA